tara:strand:+ start:1277 stop:2089 length:813 start_codon:yes stop_codon:yes gene_type:complete
MAKERTRIRAFGCSLTAQHHWTYLSHDIKPGMVWGRNKKIENFDPCVWESDNIEMKSWAIPGSGLGSSIAKYTCALLDGEIQKDDIVIFQVTNPGRLTIPINNSNKEHWGRDIRLGYNTKTLNKLPGSVSHIKNRFNGNVTSFAFDPSCNTWSQPETKLEPDEIYELLGEGRWINPWTLYNLIAVLNGIKLSNARLLVVFGWDGCFMSTGKTGLCDALDQLGIEYIKHSMLEYAVSRGDKLEESNHPTIKGYEMFTKNKLKPKLEKLGWL